MIRAARQNLAIGRRSKITNQIFASYKKRWRECRPPKRRVVWCNGPDIEICAPACSRMDRWMRKQNDCTSVELRGNTTSWWRWVSCTAETTSQSLFSGAVAPNNVYLASTNNRNWKLYLSSSTILALVRRQRIYLRCRFIPRGQHSELFQPRSSLIAQRLYCRSFARKRHAVSDVTTTDTSPLRHAAPLPLCATGEDRKVFENESSSAANQPALFLSVFERVWAFNRCSCCVTSASHSSFISSRTWSTSLHKFARVPDSSCWTWYLKKDT